MWENNVVYYLSEPYFKKKINPFGGVQTCCLFFPKLGLSQKIYLVHSPKGLQRGDKTKLVPALKTKDSQSYHLTSL